MAAARETVGELGIAPVCQVMGLPRATFYRRLRPKQGPARERRQPRALSPEQLAEVLTVLHEPRFADAAPAEVVPRDVRRVPRGDGRADLARQPPPQEPATRPPGGNDLLHADDATLEDLGAGVAVLDSPDRLTGELLDVERVAFLGRVGVG